MVAVGLGLELRVVEVDCLDPAHLVMAVVDQREV